MGTDKIKIEKDIYVGGDLYENIDQRIIDERISIFDITTFNFHLYPKDEEIAKQIKHDIQGKRFDVIKAFAGNGKQWEVELLPTTPNFDKTLKESLGKADSNRDSKIYVSGDSKNKTWGYGGQGNIVGETSSNSQIFYFVRAMKNGVIYELNFMRFYIDGEEKDKKVNCILKEIQFDRCVEDYVNKYKGNCDICYPPTSESQSEEDLKNILKERKGKSFCYNPAISFYDTPQKIAEAFIAFINECERMEQDQWMNSRKRIDMILKKTEEEITRKDFDPKKAGIPLDSFLKEWDKRGKSWKKNM